MLCREIIAICSQIHTFCGKNAEFLIAFPKIAKSDYWFRRVCLSAQNNSAPSRRIFMKFGIWVLFEILSIAFKFE